MLFRYNRDKINLKLSLDGNRKSHNINRSNSFDKIDLDSIIEKNKDKAAKKQEQRGIRRAQIYNAANMST